MRQGVSDSEILGINTHFNFIPAYFQGVLEHLTMSEYVIYVPEKNSLLATN